MKKHFIMAIAIVIFVSSCKKENPEPEYTETVLAPLSVEFDNIVGGTNLYLTSGSYVNAAGETYSVTMLQYYISNIKVSKADGTTYTVPQDQSYFLIKEGETNSANINVPEGDYTKLTFTLGVDSLRSTMDVEHRTGVLDPAGDMNSGMYWSWNSGYIFFKMEGISDAAPVDMSGQNKYRYHIGGFGGYSAPTINNIKEVTIDLLTAGEARVRKDRNSNVHLMVDIDKVMSGVTPFTIAENPMVMFSAFSTTIANNYAAMFTHDHTEN